MHLRLALVLLGITHLQLFAQHKKHFSLEKEDTGRKICFHFSSASGNCTILPSKDVNALNVYGHIDPNSVDPAFYVKQDAMARHVYLDLADENTSLARSVGMNFFSRPEKTENHWKVYISNDQVYNLNLNYGIGTADIDLSGLAIEKLKIKTGSADVNIGYQHGFPNLVKMDTFQVKVDMGNVGVNMLNYAKTKYFLAEVGFGNLSLDFSEESYQGTEVHASVGAGNFEVELPRANGRPVKIILNSSPLCRLKLPKGFKEIESNIFVNSAYRSDAKEALIFDLDVGVGSVSFRNN